MAARAAFVQPTTFLDTRSITVPRPDSSIISDWYAKPADRLEWELAVASVNRDHDYARSIILLERGAIAYREAVRRLEWEAAGGTVATRPPHGLTSADDISFSLPEDHRKQVPISLWHFDRAMARRNRAARLAACGRGEYVVTCICALGHEHHHDMGCGDYRLCMSCRVRQSINYRRDVRLFADELRERAAALSLNSALHDRLLTLTAPDYGETEERLAIRVRAWRLFSRRLGRRWQSEAERLAKVRGEKDPDVVRSAMGFLRVLEVTPGKDSLGHFHHHVWMHGPWLAQDEAHDMWRDCVLYVVRKRFKHLLDAYEQWPIWEVDIRDADPATFDVELIKYLLKDWSESKPKEGEAVAREDFGRWVAPEAFGRILRALEGVRMRQGSAGWKAIAEARREVPVCRECGTVAVAELRKVDRSPKGDAELGPGCEARKFGYEIRPPPLESLPQFGDQLRFHRFGAQ
jgi:hypothetical protein